MVQKKKKKLYYTEDHVKEIRKQTTSWKIILHKKYICQRSVFQNSEITQKAQQFLNEKLYLKLNKKERTMSLTGTAVA